MKQTLIINGIPCTIEITSQSQGSVTFTYENQPYTFHLNEGDGTVFTLVEHEARLHRGTVAHAADRTSSTISIHGTDYHIQTRQAVQRTATAFSKDMAPKAPMPGIIQSVLVKAGDRVTQHQPLVTMEAMKMQLTIKASCDAVVKHVNVSTGEAIAKGTILLRLEEQTDV